MTIILGAGFVARQRLMQNNREEKLRKLRKREKQYLSSPNTADIGCNPQEVEVKYWDVVQQYTINGVYDGTKYSGTGYDLNQSFISFEWTPGDYYLPFKVGDITFQFKQTGTPQTCVPIHFSGQNSAGGPATLDVVW